MSSKSKKNPPWSELPLELLTTIATFLKLSNPIDVLSFRTVCKSWFSSSNFTLSSLFPPFPLKIPSPPSILTNSFLHGHPVLSCTAVYALSPPDNHDDASFSKCRAYWVLFLDQITPGKKVEHRDLTVACWQMEDAAHLDLIQTHPDYLNALWPPPSWMWPIDRIERVDNAILHHLQMMNPLEKFKARVKELSQTRQDYALQFMNLVSGIDEIQNQAKLMEVDWKELKTALLWHSQSVDKDNQAEISILKAEERRISFAEVKKIFCEHNSDFDWHSFERKLNMHIIGLEESTSNFANAVKSAAMYFDEDFQ